MLHTAKSLTSSGFIIAISEPRSGGLRGPFEQYKDQAHFGATRRRLGFAFLTPSAGSQSNAVCSICPEGLHLLKNLSCHDH